MPCFNELWTPWNLAHIFWIDLYEQINLNCSFLSLFPLLASWLFVRLFKFICRFTDSYGCLMLRSDTCSCRFISFMVSFLSVVSTIVVICQCINICRLPCLPSVLFLSVLIINVRLFAVDVLNVVYTCVCRFKFSYAVLLFQWHLLRSL